MEQTQTENLNNLIDSLINKHLLGVNKDTVRMVDYTPGWKLVFEAEKKDLQSLCDNFIVEIVHVGSTSVPGIMAKPVIDIMAGAKSTDHCEMCISKIESLGYTYIPDRFDSSWFYFEKYVGNKCIAHLHLMEKSNPNYQHHLDFIRILKRNLDVAGQYQKLKQNLARKYPENSQTYCSHKADFIKSVLRKFG